MPDSSRTAVPSRRRTLPCVAFVPVHLVELLVVMLVFAILMALLPRESADVLRAAIRARAVDRRRRLLTRRAHDGVRSTMLVGIKFASWACSARDSALTLVAAV